MSKKLFEKLGAEIGDIARWLDAIQEFGLSRNSGFLTRVKLQRPEYVFAAILQRVHGDETFETKDRLKFFPDLDIQQPNHPIKITPKYGVLDGFEFYCTTDFVRTLPPDIINGTKKVISRIEKYRTKHNQT